MNSAEKRFIELYDTHYKDKEVVATRRVIELYALLPSVKLTPRLILEYEDRIEEYYEKIHHLAENEQWFMDMEMKRWLDNWDDSNESFIEKVKHRRKLEYILKKIGGAILVK